MRLSHRALVVVLGTALTTVGALRALAEGHEIPTAPAEYLAKTNPSAGNEEAIKKGKKLFEKRCAKCHGAKGDGQGKSAKGLNPPVPSYLDGYLKGRQDGQLFWIISKGSPETDMEGFGPGTSYNVSEDDIWAVIAFIKSRWPVDILKRQESITRRTQR